MAISNLVNNNEEYIKDAINNGIGAEAVNSTLGDMMTKSESLDRTPKQVKQVVETIVEMKKDTNNISDEKYSSDFVRENNEKIKSAIEDGINANEVAKTLIDSTKMANNKKNKNHLRFITKLISKMKIKELSLKKNMEKGVQKVLK